MSDKMIDKYKIVSVVGEGGMGKVFKAIHPTLKKHIIIKRLNISSKSSLSERFKREANIMMNLSHENIVSVFDHFKQGNSYFIAMEYVDGIPLEDLIERKKRISPLAAALIFREVCQGLQYAHNKGVIHRDIKPDNVMIAKNGDVKLFDFGIAMVEEEVDKELTKTGVVMGTPSYMSPEQIKDAKHVDKRTDIYSMGVMLYQMLTGKKPYPGGFSAETIHKITKGIYVKPKKLVPTIPRIFKHIIKKSMHHKMKKRFNNLEHIIGLLTRYLNKYKTQEEIHTAIKEYLHEAAGKESAFEKIPRSKRRSFVIKVAVVALAALLAAGAVFFVGTSGIYYELFSSRQTGGLEIRVNVPKDYYKDLSQVFARAVLTYYNEKAEKKEEREQTFVYVLSPEVKILPGMGKDNTEKKELFLTTNALYLPAGIYDLELTVENQKYGRSFFLNPLAVQKQNPDTPEKREIIQFSIVRPYDKKIPVTHSISDFINGKPLTGEAKIYYKGRGGWVDWKYSKGELNSGVEYTFRYVVPSYYTKDVVVNLENEMDALDMDIYMMKKPGKLILASDTEGLEILVENRREDYLGGKNRSFVEYGATTKKEKAFWLEEDKHMLTIKKDDQTFTTYQVDIKSDSITRLYVSYDKDKNTIKITQ